MNQYFDNNENLESNIVENKEKVLDTEFYMFTDNTHADLLSKYGPKDKVSKYNTIVSFRFPFCYYQTFMIH